MGASKHYFSSYNKSKSNTQKRISKQLLKNFSSIFQRKLHAYSFLIKRY